MDEQNPRLTLLKKLAVISVLGGAGFGLVVSLVLGFFFWHQSRPKPWNTLALKATYASLEFVMENQHFVVEFGYDLENRTTRDYRIGERSDLILVARLTENETLSKSIGHYQASEATIDGPTLIPPGSKARITIKVPYYYPSEFGPSEKSDPQKVGQSVNRRLKEISGFVIFDENHHYQIDLPSGWPEVKTK